MEAPRMEAGLVHCESTGCMCWGFFYIKHILQEHHSTILTHDNYVQILFQAKLRELTETMPEYVIRVDFSRDIYQSVSSHNITGLPLNMVIIMVQKIITNLV